MSRKAELIGSHFPTIYLTIISLLQGIALSQLVPIIIIYLGIVDQPFGDIYAVPLLLMLLIIFIVWHHYAIGIFFLRWFPNIIDTIIPFVISIGQFVLISYLAINTAETDIQMEAWIKGFAVFLMTGSIAYFSAAWRIDADLFLNLMSKPSAVMHVARTKKYFLLAGVSILGQGVFAYLIVLLENNVLLYVSLFLILSHLIVFEYFLLHSIKPQFIEALDLFEEESSRQT